MSFLYIITIISIVLDILSLELSSRTSNCIQVLEPITKVLFLPQ